MRAKPAEAHAVAMTPNQKKLFCKRGCRCCCFLLCTLVWVATARPSAYNHTGPSRSIPLSWASLSTPFKSSSSLTCALIQVTKIPHNTKTKCGTIVLHQHILKIWAKRRMQTPLNTHTHIDIYIYLPCVLE